MWCRVPLKRPSSSAHKYSRKADSLWERTKKEKEVKTAEEEDDEVKADWDDDEGEEAEEDVRLYSTKEADSVPFSGGWDRCCVVIDLWWLIGLIWKAV